MVMQGQSSGQTRLAKVCTSGAVVVGLVLVFYYTLWLLGIAQNSLPSYGLNGASPGVVVGIGLYVILMGLLSIVAGVGYARKARWGWYVHLVAAIGMLAFPGALFEFKLDVHHMIAWLSALLTLVMVILMGFSRRKPG